MAVPLVPPLVSSKEINHSRPRTDLGNASSTTRLLDSIDPKSEKARGRRKDSIPPELQEAINRFAAELTITHNFVLTATPRLRYRLARLLASKLPPAARRSGRPGRQDVSEAIRLRTKLRRTEPNPRRIWEKICIAVIPDYELLPEWDRKEIKSQLRERVRWRLAARARRRQHETRNLLTGAGRG